MLPLQSHLQTSPRRDSQTSTIGRSPRKGLFRAYLKQAITKGPILRLPDHSREFILRTDASYVGEGVVLLQEHNNRLFPVAFASKKLLEREWRLERMLSGCLEYPPFPTVSLWEKIHFEDRPPTVGLLGKGEIHN